jgi:hypothetical protein
MFIDSLLAESKFEDFKLFIISSKYNTHDEFMQGVCLRLEQVVMTYENHEIGNQAIDLLKDIESLNTGLIQEVARLSINRIQGNINLISYGLTTTGRSIVIIVKTN